MNHAHRGENPLLHGSPKMNAKKLDHSQIYTFLLLKQPCQYSKELKGNSLMHHQIMNPVTKKSKYSPWLQIEGNGILLHFTKKLVLLTITVPNWEISVTSRSLIPYHPHKKWVEICPVGDTDDNKTLTHILTLPYSVCWSPLSFEGRVLMTIMYWRAFLQQQSCILWP